MKEKVCFNFLKLKTPNLENKNVLKPKKFNVQNIFYILSAKNQKRLTCCWKLTDQETGILAEEYYHSADFQKNLDPTFLKD